MVIDCHYHLENELLPVEELLKKMDESGVDKTVLMGQQIPPYPEPSPFLIGLLQFILTNRPFKPIGKLFIASFTSRGIKIMGNEYPIFPDPDNTPVFDMVDRYAERFLGWVFVNPRGQNDPVKEYEKWRNHPGCAGIKAHSFWNHHTPYDLAPVAEKATVDGKPIIIHLGYGDNGNYEKLLSEVPGVKLILAHTAFPGYHQTWKKIKDMDNVYVDLSQTSYVGPRVMREAVDYLGVEKCVFGTDGPYGFHGRDGKFDYGLIKRRIENLFKDPGTQRRLLGENFTEIAGLDN